MSITDELRKWGYGFCGDTHDVVNAIADRIDAEHEALRDQLDTSERQKESYREDLLAANRQVHAAYNDGFDDGFASADDWLAQHEDAMAMHGWIRLPKDADGEYIHVGDVMESKGSDFLFDEASFEVRAMRYDEGGWEVYDRLGDRYAPSLLRHYHAPTVEDVMVEFATDWEHAEDGEGKTAVLKEYAAKLRLAEEDA